jgi:hypothetical protein
LSGLRTIRNAPIVSPGEGAGVDRIDAAIEDDRDCGIAVDVDDVEADAVEIDPLRRRDAMDAGEEVQDLGPADERAPCRRHLAAAVADQDDVVGQHFGERVGVAVSQRGGKALDDLALPAPIAGSGAGVRAPVAEPCLGAVDQLPGIFGRRLQHPADFARVVLEHFAQQKGGPFLRRQRLEEHHERQRHRFGEHCGVLGSRTLVGEDGLRQPRADVLLARGAGGFQPVETQARDNRGQKRFGRTHVRSIGRRVAQPRVLHGVLGFAGAAEHAVGDTEQLRAIAFE